VVARHIAKRCCGSGGSDDDADCGSGAPSLANLIVVDAFAGVGGNTVQLAMVAK
jgi:hypothetical protein